MLAMLFALLLAAQPTVLLEKSLLLDHGAVYSECFEAPPGRLLVEAWSPPGRTGEDATLYLSSPPIGPYRGPTPDDEMYVEAVLGLERTAVAGRVGGGTYCVEVVVSGQIPQARRIPADSPVKPYKSVVLKVSHQP